MKLGSLQIIYILSFTYIYIHFIIYKTFIFHGLPYIYI